MYLEGGLHGLTYSITVYMCGLISNFKLVAQSVIIILVSMGCELQTCVDTRLAPPLIIKGGYEACPTPHSRGRVRG